MLKIYYKYYKDRVANAIRTKEEELSKLTEQRNKIQITLSFLQGKTLNDDETKFLNIKQEENKILVERIYNARGKLNMFKKVNLDYQIIKFVIDEFIVELFDKFIKGEMCVLKLPHFFYLVLRKTVPKLHKKGDKMVYSVSWQKSLAYRKELIEKGIKVREAGSEEGENWLLPRTEDYPAIVWFKSFAGMSPLGVDIREKFRNIWFQPNRRFVKSLYEYIKNKPETLELYNIHGNGWIIKNKKWANSR